MGQVIMMRNAFTEAMNDIKYRINNDRDEAIKFLASEGDMIAKIDNQDAELCLIAVDSNPYALQFVRNQTPEICLAAVKKDGMVLRHVKEQTPEICVAAVQSTKLPELLSEIKDKFSFVEVADMDLLLEIRAKTHGQDFFNWNALVRLKDRLIMQSKIIEKMPFEKMTTLQKRAKL